MTAVSKQTVHSRGIALAMSAALEGSGVPVIFIHADLGNRRQWDGAFDHLKGQRPLVSYDRCGHGDSTCVDGTEYSYEAEVRDLVSVADAAGFKRFVLVGHSGGGAIAYLFAQAYPERTAGLFLVEPAQASAAMPPEQRRQALEQTRQAPKQAATAFYCQPAGPNDKVADRVIEDVERTPDAAIIGMVEALGNFDPNANGDRYDGPGRTLIRSGTDSSHQLHRIGGLQHEEIDGVGHWIQLDAPERVIRALDAFLG